MLSTNRFKTLKSQGHVIFKSRFLENLSLLERYEFLQLCHRRKYNKDEFIYYQDDPGTGMYFIEEGKVQLVIESQADSDEEERIFTIEAPENFGALSITYELRRMSSAKCLTDCTLLGFFKPDFETLKKRHPAIAVKFMETLALMAMKQFEISIKALKEFSGPVKAYTLQFEAYYSERMDNEPL